MIARQAASIEMVLRGDITGNPTSFSAVCDKILLGTVPSLTLEASSHPAFGHHFVLLSAGLIQFLYEMAKATVLTWKPTDSGSFSSRMSDTQELIENSPVPQSMFLMTLKALIFQGLPRATTNNPPPRNYQVPLRVLTNFNERFLVAHEYSHMLFTARDEVFNGPTSQKDEEHSADVFAFLWLVESAMSVDEMAPNIAVQSTFLTLSIIRIVFEALDLLRYGEVKLEHSTSHPSSKQRSEVLKEVYRQRVSAEDNDLSLEPSLFPAQCIELLWEQSQDAWLTFRDQPVHPMWRA